MKQVSFTLAALLLSGSLQAHTWKLDRSHANLNFSIPHMMVSDVEGSFKNFNATIQANKPDFSDAVVNFTAEIKSVNTDNQMRDEHLQGEDVFDAAKFPTMSFTSRRMKPAGKNKYKLYGDLTMHGVTKPVVLDVIYRGTITNPMNKKTVAGFKVSGIIKRSDFGVGTKYPNAVLGDEVTISANAEFEQES